MSNKICSTKQEVEKFLEELKNNFILQDIQSINYHMRIRR